MTVVTLNRLLAFAILSSGAVAAGDFGIQLDGVASGFEMMLGIGQTVWYTADHKIQLARPRHTSYSIYEPVARTRSQYQNLKMPDEPRLQESSAVQAVRSALICYHARQHV